MQDDLYNSPEQDVLRGTFRIAGKAGPSTPCPCCCPNSTSKRVGGWERGLCGELVAMRCNNCGFIRTSKPRATQRHKGLTLGQERGVMKVVATLERFIHKAERFAITHKLPESGPYSTVAVYVSFTWALKEDGNAFLNVMENGWCSFVIGVNGGLKLVSYYCGTGDRKHQDEMAGYLATMAGATLRLL